MYELIQISEHDYYIDCPAKIGLVKISGNEVVAIDSGSDKDSAKKILRHIEENGWKLTSVFITHSHADHVGGNKLLQERTGCTSYAQGIETVFSNNPILEPMTLYGGYPFNELKNKFLMAQESNILPLTEKILPDGFEIIQLPGHSFAMAGFKTPDGNVFLADCLISKETLNKYGISYLWDVETYLQTLENVKKMQGNLFIPAHAPVTKNITELAQYNIDAVHKTIATILEFLKIPQTFEQLLQNIFTSYGLNLSAQQYVLIGSTLRSYLAYLKNKGFVSYTFENNQMLWKIS